MTAQVNQSNPGLTSGVSGISNSSMTQINAGATALASVLLYEMMAMYATIMNLESEQKKSMALAQGAEANGQADAQIQGASQLATGEIVQGAMSIAGAGGTIVGIGVGAKSASDANTQLQEANEELTPLNQTNKLLKTTMAAGEEEGGVNMEPVIKPGELTVEQLVEQFKQQNYANIGVNEDTTKAALATLLQNPDDYAAWKSQFDTNFNTYTQQVNTHTQAVTNAQQSGSNVGQIIGGVVTGTGNVVKGAQDSKKGQQDAYATVMGAASNLAQSAGGDWSNAFNTTAQTYLNIANLLDKFNQASKTQ